LKENYKNKHVSEKSVYDQTNSFYREQGAVDQSFNTIAAFGPNSAIIHYSDASDSVLASDGQLALLDSGALYASGYATDTTRTIFMGQKPSSKHKEIYTLVLKGLINAESAVFPAGTTGAGIDALARIPITKKGYNYMHGTGHGVGINVHEGGFGISPINKSVLTEGQVGSIEPGIYLQDFGGVRLENVVEVVKHPAYEGMFCFRPLVYIGYDHSLIEEKLLTQEELDYLRAYEKECQRRGRTL